MKEGREMEVDKDKFYKDLPKVELHAHLNGSISADTMRRLVRLHREKWPEEPMPEQCDLVVEGGQYHGVLEAMIQPPKKRHLGLN